MSDLQSDLNSVVQQFVAQIAQIARTATIETLSAAFAVGAGETPKAMKGASAPAAVGPGRPQGGRGRGVKRNPDDIAATAARLLVFVKANPGLRIEQINKALGTETKDLALPVRKLLASKAIVAKGEKRATTYFPGRKG